MYPDFESHLSTFPEMARRLPCLSLESGGGQRLFGMEAGPLDGQKPPVSNEAIIGYSDSPERTLLISSL